MTHRHCEEDVLCIDIISHFSKSDEAIHLFNSFIERCSIKPLGFSFVAIIVTKILLYSISLQIFAKPEDSFIRSMTEQQYFIYIMTTISNTALYTGVTNDLQRRVLEHRTNHGGTFTKKYKLYKLVYFESGDSITAAIAREKQIKGGSRSKKIDLINSINPEWEDLYERYFE